MGFYCSSGKEGKRSQSSSKALFSQDAHKTLELLRQEHSSPSNPTARLYDLPDIVKPSLRKVYSFGAFRLLNNSKHYAGTEDHNEAAYGREEKALKHTCTYIYIHVSHLTASGKGQQITEEEKAWCNFVLSRQDAFKVLLTPPHHPVQGSQLGKNNRDEVYFQAASAHQFRRRPPPTPQNGALT